MIINIISRVSKKYLKMQTEPWDVYQFDFFSMYNLKQYFYEKKMFYQSDFLMFFIFENVGVYIFLIRSIN